MRSHTLSLLAWQGSLYILYSTGNWSVAGLHLVFVCLLFEDQISPYSMLTTKLASLKNQLL